VVAPLPFPQLRQSLLKAAERSSGHCALGQYEILETGLASERLSRAPLGHGPTSFPTGADDLMNASLRPPDEGIGSLSLWCLPGISTRSLVAPFFEGHCHRQSNNQLYAASDWYQSTNNYTTSGCVALEIGRIIDVAAMTLRVRDEVL
jgi:hypothetical protein